MYSVTHDEGPCQRSLHVAAIWRDKMLCFGGYDGSNRVNDCWEFDFGKRSWSLVVPASGSPPTPRDRHVAVVWGSSFYVFAGFDGTSRITPATFLRRGGDSRRKCGVNVTSPGSVKLNPRPSPSLTKWFMPWKTFSTHSVFAPVIRTSSLISCDLFIGPSGMVDGWLLALTELRQNVYGCAGDRCDSDSGGGGVIVATMAVALVV